MGSSLSKEVFRVEEILGPEKGRCWLGTAPQDFRQAGLWDRPHPPGDRVGRGILFLPAHVITVGCPVTWQARNSLAARVERDFSSRVQSTKETFSSCQIFVQDRKLPNWTIIPRKKIRNLPGPLQFTVVETGGCMEVGQEVTAQV